MSVASESNSEGERDPSLLEGMLYSERSEVGSAWSDTFKNALSSEMLMVFAYLSRMTWWVGSKAPMSDVSEREELFKE